MRFDFFVAPCRMVRRIQGVCFFLGIGWTCALFFSFGCRNAPSSPAPIAATSEHSLDTLVVLCSRLFESKTYEDYLSRLASDSLVFEFFDAGLLREDEWSNMLKLSDGILLTGGADLNPKLYDQAGDTILCGDIHPIRDSVEVRLLTWVDDTGLPCLGICRGLQHMNVFAGGTLDAHLPRKHGDMHRAGNQGDTRDTVHLATVVSIPHGVHVELQDESRVISHHHQGIDELGEELDVWAVAPDGLPEGIVHKDSVRFPFYVGVQWHPERSEHHQDLVEPIGKGFIEAMLQRQN